MCPCSNATATSTASVLMSQLCRKRRNLFCPGRIICKSNCASLRRKTRSKLRRERCVISLIFSRVRCNLRASREILVFQRRHICCLGIVVARRKRHCAGRETSKTCRRFCVHRRADVRQKWKSFFRGPAEQPHHGVERGRKIVHVHGTVATRKRHDVRRERKFDRLRR